jgi:diadenosine tetraphosphate (Ap4A) HIT family hydrolase
VSTPAAVAGCPLCEAPGGLPVAATDRLRVIRAAESGFPAFYRVVWTTHAAEFTDLAPADRLHCMEVVAAVEDAMRRHLGPDKVNLAALGNMVPHLHWHVIARFRWDSRWPGAVWAPPQRETPAQALAELETALPALDRAIAAALAPAA